MGLSIWHILVLIIVVTLLFGTGRVPRVMEDVAKGIKAFKKGMKEDDKPQIESAGKAEEVQQEKPKDTVSH
jgi:sec-independent protein translocase protein TatA